MTIPLLAIALAAALAVIVWQWHRHRRDVQKADFLFNAIDNGDYSFRFREGRHGGDRQLNAILNRVKGILQHARDEQMEHEKYFELILDSVDTGIIVTDEERGLVLRSNRAARHLLHRDAITHVRQVEERLKGMSVRESHTVLQGRRVAILGFSDIHDELANQETDAWMKLIRVLTHEIMNSMTPIISLSETLLRQAKGEQRAGLEVIHSTGKELLRFVENYRKFSHVPPPQPRLFYVRPFLERMRQAGTPLLPEGCAVSVDVEPKDLLVYADEGLVSRVVGNLLKNAAEAVAAGGHVALKAWSNAREQVVIDVGDDGPAIPGDLAAHIFIPFFTTKKDGSGIGLSISRQIMRVMGGTLELVGDEGDGLTTFRLTFN